MDNRTHYKGYMWSEIKGRGARRFAKRVWDDRDKVFGQQEFPIETIFNNRPVMVWGNRVYRRDEYVGSRTVTKEQIENRPKAQVVKARVRSRNYEPVHFKHREE